MLLNCILIIDLDSGCAYARKRYIDAEVLKESLNFCAVIAIDRNLSKTQLDPANLIVNLINALLIELFPLLSN